MCAVVWLLLGCLLTPNEVDRLRNAIIDSDGDGFRDITLGGTDCDDERFDVNPEAPETCDSTDQDCDGRVDESPTDGVVAYIDEDGDGYGAGLGRSVCRGTPGWVENDLDCDDQWPSALPGGTEVCDDHDNDCDGQVDENGADGELAWYPDADADGVGAGEAIHACKQPAGHASVGGDCDDNDDLRSPLKEEQCNDGVDNDCDDGTTCSLAGAHDLDVIAAWSVTGDLVSTPLTIGPFLSGGEAGLAVGSGQTTAIIFGLNAPVTAENSRGSVVGLPTRSGSIKPGLLPRFSSNLGR